MQDKNILYLFRLYTASDNFLKSKFFSQIKAFKYYFTSVFFFQVINQELVLFKDNIIIKSIKIPIYIRYFPFLYYFYVYKKVLIYLKSGLINIQVIYIRNYFISFTLLNLLHLIKKLNLFLYIELPTYPIAYEILTYGNFFKVIFLLINNIFIKYISKYTYRFILITSDLDHIYYSKVISIDNCIDCSTLSFQSNTNYKNFANLTFIANFSKWHGLDRFLNSFLYYVLNNTNRFHIFLICPKKNKELKRVYRKFKYLFSKKYVTVEDPNNKKNILDITSMAISSLALFRIKVNKASVLKSREYACQGLPILYGYEDNVLDRFPNLFRKITNDNSLIDFSEIFRFIENFNLNFVENKKAILDVALNKMNWKTEYEKVFVHK